jgi:acyl dehydratase
VKPGDPIELRVVPDPYVTFRYAGASGDFNPIHIDDAFAREVGLPGLILHGLWTMALLARAASEAAGGPDRLRRLTVEFRGTGVPGEEIVVSGAVSGEGAPEGRLVAKLDAAQAGRRIIKHGLAEIDAR